MMLNGHDETRRCGACHWPESVGWALESWSVCEMNIYKVTSKMRRSECISAVPLISSTRYGWLGRWFLTLGSQVSVCLPDRLKGVDHEDEMVWSWDGVPKPKTLLATRGWRHGPRTVVACAAHIMRTVKHKHKNAMLSMLSAAILSSDS